jgi:hypothetical protein
VGRPDKAPCRTSLCQSEVRKSRSGKGVILIIILVLIVILLLLFRKRRTKLEFKIEL